MKARWRAHWLQSAASCGILVAAALAFPNLGFANGRTIGPTSTITAANSAALGFSMASATQSDGSTIVVIGAPQSNNGAGAAYVFVELSGSGWSTLPTSFATLTATTPVVGSGFGDSVAINNTGTILVGAPGTSSTSGAVYEFTPGNLGWSLTTSQSTTPTLTGSTGEMFGISVGVSNNLGSSASPKITAVVGADNLTVSSQTDAGAAYVYTDSSTGWSTTPAVITDPGVTANDLFGNSVAITSDGGTVLIGASGSTSNAGQAYVYTGSGSSWTKAATLFVSGTIDFGTSVAIGGTTSGGATAVIGAPGNASSPGAAYVFASSSTTGWNTTPAADLTTGTNGDFLGTSVAISGDGNTIAVGAPDAPSTSSPTPALYEFDAPSNGKHAGNWSANNIRSDTYQISNTGSTYFGDSAAVVIDSSGTAWIFGGAPGIPPITSSLPIPNPVPPGAAYVFTQ